MSEATTAAYSAEELQALKARFRDRSADEVLRWAADTFAPDIKVASSFGAEDVVLIDMIARESLPITVFTLDTGRLHDETYEVMQRVRERYGIDIETMFPDREAVERLVTVKGFYSFRESVENRRECCGIRKVEPLGRALAGQKAWLTGLRRDQAVTRGDTDAIEWDEAHGLVKVNPLVEWTDDQVWEYVRAHNVPYNRLHDQGFPSIGCAPCTRAIKPGEDIRAGRWWWELPENKECGLHG